MKTAELFALSCELGASHNNASAPVTAALRKYGLAFGTAYQIYDDCLDLFGTETVVGKTLGIDLVNGKLTLPVLIALEKVTGSERSRVQELLGEWDPAFFPQLADLFGRYDVLQECREVVTQLISTARQVLSILPSSGSRASLYALTDFFAQQTEALGVSG